MHSEACYIDGLYAEKCVRGKNKLILSAFKTSRTTGNMKLHDQQYYVIKAPEIHATDKYKSKIFYILYKL